MAIDNCKYSFMELASKQLPKYMRQLRESMTTPFLMSEFTSPGVGIGTFLQNHGLDSDFQGCYVLLERDQPIYVGISKKVFQRLRQHVRGTTHFDASLAYRIAADGYPHSMTRSEAMATEAFQRLFNKAKMHIESLSAGTVEIVNPLELYLFEPYCAMELDTGKWNTFETH